MQEDSKDYELCIKLALDNAKKRISTLDNSDKKKRNRRIQGMD